MKSLFDSVSAECSKITTSAYSTSFSLGIYFLKSNLRNPIYSIYGFVRFADEIVDSFSGYDQAYLFQKFREDTFESIEKRISLNPILNSFQQVVHQYNISLHLIDTFLKSMEMDLQKINYTSQKYEQYIFGSAEAVGLMCLHVFTDGNLKQYEELSPLARKLGAAYQKVNFLRDLKSDYQILGRSYFPNVDLAKFNSQTKQAIEKEIEQDFDQALLGIKLLPNSSKGGVYLSYVYYKALFNKIKRLQPDQVLTKRIRISNGQKFGLMINSMFQYKLKLV